MRRLQGTQGPGVTRRSVLVAGQLEESDSSRSLRAWGIQGMWPGSPR